MARIGVKMKFLLGVEYDAKKLSFCQRKTYQECLTHRDIGIRLAGMLKYADFRGKQEGKSKKLKIYSTILSEFSAFRKADIFTQYIFFEVKKFNKNKIDKIIPEYAAKVYYWRFVKGDPEALSTLLVFMLYKMPSWLFRKIKKEVNLLAKQT